MTKRTDTWLQDYIASVNESIDSGSTMPLNRFYLREFQKSLGDSFSFDWVIYLP